MNEYGVLAQVVQIAGTLIAATAAIGLSWRGRAKWEPWEQDVPKGPQRVGGLLAAVTIAILWFLGDEFDNLLQFTLILAVLTLFFLILYGYLIAVHTYYVIEVIDGVKGITEQRKIIGGFNLNKAAQKMIEENSSLTVQDYLKGTAYNYDLVWTRPSRAIAKQLFVLSYIGLIFSGTVALAGAALLISQSL